MVRILILEDDESKSSEWKEALEQAGHEVVTTPYLETFLNAIGIAVTGVTGKHYDPKYSATEPTEKPFAIALVDNGVKMSKSAPNQSTSYAEALCHIYFDDRLKTKLPEMVAVSGEGRRVFINELIRTLDWPKRGDPDHDTRYDMALENAEIIRKTLINRFVSTPDDRKPTAKELVTAVKRTVDGLAKENFPKLGEKDGGRQQG
ncbi:MAG: hypothetical protein H6908_02960 [Hyphomicrobiales bacterium]|nr:hypothetical protein [Hyphomicrobiales bacterium]